MTTSPPRTIVRAFPWVLAAATLLFTAQARADVRATIDDVAPKVVKIFGAGGLHNLYSYSSGFLVSPEGHIVTVWSHVLDQNTVTVILHDGRRFEGKVLGAEPPQDLAMIKIDAEQLPHFDLTSTTTAGAGTRVLSFSNMFKVATGDEPVSVMHGVIAARTSLAARRGAYDSPYTGEVYVVDAITNNPGSGGGVLTTLDGRLLGMVGKELRNTQTNTWMNYVMPIDDLKSTIEKIRTGDFRASSASTQASLGPRIFTPLDFGLVMVPDVVQRTPAYVDRVVPGSEAARAGLQSNDLVLFVGDELVRSHRALQKEFDELETGGTLKIVVRRGDQLVTTQLNVPRTAPRPPRQPVATPVGTPDQ